MLKLIRTLKIDKLKDLIRKDNFKIVSSNIKIEY